MTNDVWGMGSSPVPGRYEGGSWLGQALDLSWRLDELAASDGRVALSRHHGALYVWEAGVLTTTPVDRGVLYLDAAAEGVFFALGVADDDRPRVLRESGAGWQPIDTSPLPEQRWLASGWADGPDDLWVGAVADDGPSLWHWTDGAWTLEVDGLPSNPDWMARLADGQLYFADSVGEDSLWLYDGTTVSVVEDMPAEIRAAHLGDDGTWWVSTLAIGGTTGVLLKGSPDAGWIEVWQSSPVIPVVGVGDSAWAGGYDTSWVDIPCPP